jgi:hypothetical protein
LSRIGLLAWTEAKISESSFGASELSVQYLIPMAN